MKKLTLKFSALLFLFAHTFSAFGSDFGNLRASLNLKNNKAVEIHLEGQSSGEVQVKVFNNTGRMVSYKSLVNSGTKIVSHKISDFPDGIYTYQVIEGDELIYTAKVVKSAEGALECRNLPGGATASISKEDSAMVLVRMVKSPESKLKILVSDDDANILYRKMVKDASYAKLTYDISAFPEGNYYFSVYKNNELIAYRKIIK
ncbi:MAG: T9SS type A sorting domain-containing protein [Bacteroidales bacterium]|nr:T9SS type A sorting domain-containing protein [Bacteroidales bacterium]